jgi:dTDP-4-amino-4,6-dideoxygalactose transaminase
VNAPLAILGSPPRFPEPLHVGRPNRGNREDFLALVAEIWDRNWFTNDGPLVHQFEAEIARQCGVPHCVAVCNATVGLEIAMSALDLRGEVVMPAYTFVATAHAARWQGLQPVFVDVGRQTHTLLPEAVEAAITPRTTAIVGVHLWGRPAATSALEEIATRHGLKLLFDAAHAFRCGFPDRMVGSFGNAEVLSFHATKFVNAFEGGAILTRDDDLARRMRLMRNFGFAGMDKVIHLGTNGKMSEVSAAMGLTSLAACDAIIEINRSNLARYRERLTPLGLDVMGFDDVPFHNHQYVVVEVNPERFGLDRDELVRVLHAEGVLARRYFHPGCHNMEPYRSEAPPLPLHLPNTEHLCRSVLLLPTGTSVGQREVDGIAEIVATVRTRTADIRRTLEELDAHS